jgi:hypothetical protein
MATEYIGADLSGGQCGGLCIQYFPIHRHHIILENDPTILDSGETTTSQIIRAILWDEHQGRVWNSKSVNEHADTRRCEFDLHALRDPLTDEHNAGGRGAIQI